VKDVTNRRGVDLGTACPAALGAPSESGDPVIRSIALFVLTTAPALAAEGGGNTTVLFGGLGALVLACAALVAVARPWGLLASGLSGLGLSAYLYVQHHAAKAGAVSACNVSGTINCDAVNTSRWSELGGVPIALLGAGYFAAVAFLAVQRARGSSAKAAGLIAGLAGAGVAYDVFLAWASSQIGALCVFCAATWALNLILLVGAWLDTREHGGVGAALAESLRTDAMNAGIVGLGVVIVGGVAFRGAEAEKASNAQAASADPSALASYYEQPAGVVELDGTESVKGPADARFTIVEWADFQCPHCALMNEEMKKVLDQNKDLKLLYKHYPISDVCNRFVDGARHADACTAAAAADCAGKQGRFYELASSMFKNQEYLGKDDIRFMAEQQQLDMAAFEACMGDPATAEGVKADVEAGGKAGIQGTPSLFLKGAFGDQWVRLTLQDGGAGINALLAAARAGTPLPQPSPSTER
jgi:protein-disulfide isomerase/uncharacterized membrane protein